jgi:hypothetical protein
VRDGALLLIENHGAEEVHGRVHLALDVLGEFAGDVFPQRGPVVGHVPDVLALKERDFELLIGLEDREEGDCVGLHDRVPGFRL